MTPLAALGPRLPDTLCSKSCNSGPELAILSVGPPCALAFLMPVACNAVAHCKATMTVIDGLRTSPPLTANQISLISCAFFLTPNQNARTTARKPPSRDER
jgi:hypothetical protein